ncbi:DUF1611 domain-containing protein [Dokdonella sp.]|uniref:DUF1611 domain-containing protein n=1 Tax=Dokdonella sp. TaxID=2291710 RepID=UPI00352834B1
MRALSLAQSSVATTLQQPYLLFLGDVTELAYAKTALGLRDWAGDLCIGEFTCPGATVSTGLPTLTPAQARSAGAQSMVIGVANAGGVIPQKWIPALTEALEAGLDLVSGMHVHLEDVPQLKAAALRHGCRLVDVRRPPAGIPIASGRPRSGKRLLTVGTDCALGKKYTALALARAFRKRNIDVDFRATGQTGILIAGSGIPMDAVVADFAAGAAEMLSPAADAGHWDVIEGQGSLSHPAYAGVSLALLHGSQPDVFVVCHAPERKVMLGFPDFPMPEVEDTIAQTILLGKRTNPAIRCAGVSLNTSQLDEASASRLIASECERLGCAVADPVRGGAAFEQLVDACLA